jgi:hypothetical protein
MFAQVRLFNPKPVGRWRRRAIVSLAVAVFALGLRGKLCLFEPPSPAVALKIIKLSSHDPADAKAALAPPCQSDKRSIFDVVARLHFFQPLSEASKLAYFRQDSVGLLVPVSAAQSRYAPFLFFKPPPMYSLA